jgi:hypothetical protein
LNLDTEEDDEIDIVVLVELTSLPARDDEGGTPEGSWGLQLP